MSGFISAGFWIFNLKHLKLYAKENIYSAYSLRYTDNLSHNQAKI